jgi:hypothetical protein
LLTPPKEQRLIREVFLSSYAEGKKKNQFTKVQMNLEVDSMLLDYFNTNVKSVENWFNIISPEGKKLSALKNELKELKNKNWVAILK